MKGGGGVADAIVRWQRQHGRRSLPWQNTRDPYRVWLSEIMLQQTQVVTVLGYYAKFLQQFPDVQTLAAAPEEAVFALWSGLGYYSRARNLHKAAHKVVSEFGGVFPSTSAQLVQLPGVGRSTAAAIAAFCFGERVPILDANVRRVLTRFFAFEHDLSRPIHERALWALAAELVPLSASDMPAYTQGLMDLGASVCTSRNPTCEVCPLLSACAARQLGDIGRYPVRSRRTQRKQESWWLWVLRDAGGRTWLDRRPAPGIWAGLYCTPVFGDEPALRKHGEHLGVADTQTLAPFRHALTHRELLLYPVLALLPVGRALDGQESGAWFSPEELGSVGLPAPIRSLLLGNT
ncbi:MAG: A/G-specific adenine glycosylase [Giesbergeria sp.]